MGKILTAKEREFCAAFLESGNAEKSALRVGYSRQPVQTAEKLLRREEIVCEIERLAKQKQRISSALAVSGYSRMAFGSIADAVSLLYTDKPSAKQLEDMDLFMVSEIKKPKNEALEIKFFDRMKALEKLEDAEVEGGGNKSLFDAISSSARAMVSSKNEH